MADPQAFVRLFSQHGRAIHTYVLSLVPQMSDAEDVFQEASLVMWTKFDSYQPGTNFTAWACTIAKYCALNHYRKHKKFARLFSESFLAAIDAQMAELNADESERELRQRLLQRCLDTLPNHHRHVVDQRYVNRQTTKQIGNAVGKSPNAIRKLLVRVRAALADCIQSHLKKEQSA